MMMTALIVGLKLAGAVDACGMDDDGGIDLACVLAEADAGEDDGAGLAARFPEVAPLGASGMLRVDEDANDDECAQY